MLFSIKNFKKFFIAGPRPAFGARKSIDNIPGGCAAGAA